MYTDVYLVLWQWNKHIKLIASIYEHDEKVELAYHNGYSNKLYQPVRIIRPELIKSPKCRPGSSRPLPAPAPLPFLFLGPSAGGSKAKGNTP